MSDDFRRHRQRPRLNHRSRGPKIRIAAAADIHHAADHNLGQGCGGIRRGTRRRRPRGHVHGDTVPDPVQKIDGKTRATPRPEYVNKLI